MVYVQRIVPEGSSPWLVFKGVESLRAGALLTNTFLAILLAAIVASWFRLAWPSKKTWHMSLVAWLFLAVLGVGCVLRHQARFNEYQRQRAVLREFDVLGWWTYPSGTPIPWYVRPFADLGMVSDECWHNFAIAWEPETVVHTWDENGTFQSEQRPPEGTHVDINRLLKEIGPKLRQLAYCDEFSIADARLTDSGVESLCVSVKRCRALTLCCHRNNVTDAALLHIANHLPTIEELVINGVSVSEEGVTYLNRLRKLSLLALRDIPSVCEGGNRSHPGE